MQLWNFEGSYVVFACPTPVVSSIGRPRFSLRRTRADNLPCWMKRCLAKLVRGLRRHDGPAMPPREPQCRAWPDRPAPSGLFSRLGALRQRPPFQKPVQTAPGVAFPCPHDVLGRTGRDDLAAGVAAFGTTINAPVG